MEESYALRKKTKLQLHLILKVVENCVKSPNQLPPVFYCEDSVLGFGLVGGVVQGSTHWWMSERRM